MISISCISSAPFGDRGQVPLHIFLQAQAKYGNMSSNTRLVGQLGIAHLRNAATCARGDALGLLMPAGRCQYPIAPTDSGSRHIRHAILRQNAKNLLIQAGHSMRGSTSPPSIEEVRSRAQRSAQLSTDSWQHTRRPEITEPRRSPSLCKITSKKDI